MADLSLSSAHARLLGMLVRAREDAGLSARQIAAAAGWSQAKASRLERGARKPLPADVQTWMAVALGSDKTETMTAAVELAHEVIVEARPWSLTMAKGAAERQADYGELETEAIAVAVWQNSVLPGIAQTPQYARAVIELGVTPADQIDGKVAARMMRQARMRQAGRNFTLMVREPVLTLRVVPAQTLNAQLAHLEDMQTWPSVALGIIPADAIPPALPLDGFELWEFDDGRGLVIAETLTQELVIEEPGDVDLYRESFNRWRSVAVFGAEAFDILQRSRASLDG